MSSETKEKKKGGCLKVFLIVLVIVVVLVAAAGIIFWRMYKKESEKMQDKMHNTTLVGQDCPEFEVTTTDGKKTNLKELLDGKDVLCLVFFATWCGPCEKEFPEMDNVYRKYQDKLGMIGLDIDVLDGEEDAKKYADKHGFAFPIAKVEKENPLFDFVNVGTYPTTLIIDRNGKVGMHRIGSIPKEEDFEKMVTTFMGDDYQEKTLAYYTFYAVQGNKAVPGVEFTVTSENGTETYVTDEDGFAGVLNDKPEDLKVKVTKVPEGVQISGTGEITTGIGSTPIELPVK